MAQTGYTPIQLYYSATTTNVPLAANLAAGELAVNTADGKLFYKDSGGTVQVIAWKTTPATAGGTGQTTYTTGDVLYASGSAAISKLGIGTTGQLLSVSAGGVPEWATFDALPDQTGHSGQYLTTDGSTASWANVGASAGGVIYENSTEITTSYTLATGKNGFSVGPITIDSGASVTVPSGQRWVIL